MPQPANTRNPLHPYATHLDALDDAYEPRREERRFEEYARCDTRIPNDWDDQPLVAPRWPKTDDRIGAGEIATPEPEPPVKLPEEEILEREQEVIPPDDRFPECKRRSRARLMRYIGIILLVVCILLAASYVSWLVARMYTGYPPAPSTDPAVARIELAVKQISARLPQTVDIAELEKVISKQLKDIREEIVSLNGKVGALGKPLTAKDLDPLKKETMDIHSQGNLILEELKKLSQKWQPCAENSTTAPLSMVSPMLLEQSSRATVNDYRAIDEAITGLLTLNPQDARVWYLAAVARGYSTGQFNSAIPLNRVTTGTSLELSGQPSKEIVDQYLKLFPRDAVDWLNSYRPKNSPK